MNYANMFGAGRVIRPLGGAASRALFSDVAASRVLSVSALDLGAFEWAGALGGPIVWGAVALMAGVVAYQAYQDYQKAHDFGQNGGGNARKPAPNAAYAPQYSPSLAPNAFGIGDGFDLPAIGSGQGWEDMSIYSYMLVEGASEPSYSTADRRAGFPAQVSLRPLPFNWKSYWPDRTTGPFGTFWNYWRFNMAPSAEPQLEEYIKVGAIIPVHIARISIAADPEVAEEVFPPIPFVWPKPITLTTGARGGVVVSSGDPDYQGNKDKKSKQFQKATMAFKALEELGDIGSIVKDFYDAARLNLIEALNSGETFPTDFWLPRVERLHMDGSLTGDKALQRDSGWRRVGTLAPVKQLSRTGRLQRTTPLDRSRRLHVTGWDRPGAKMVPTWSRASWKTRMAVIEGGFTNYGFDVDKLGHGLSGWLVGEVMGMAIPSRPLAGKSTSYFAGPQYQPWNEL